jgi:hypothetical protein
MIEVKKAHELDIVELTEDLPEYGLHQGAQGTVVEVFDRPEEAYMIEFLEDSGASSKIADWVKPDQIKNIGNDILNKPKHEQKISRGQRVTSERRYIFALLFASIFIASTTTLLIIYKSFTPGYVNHAPLSSDVAIWATVFTTIVSAIGTFSTIILAWRSDRRDAREKELKIAQLERDLEASREKPALPILEEKRK